MDPKELEDKLEKDNLTLKEHILKLQNTIKNIKTELSNTNNNTTYVNTLSQIDISTIKNSKVESPKNNGKLNIKDDSDEEINNLKFSFKNIKAEQKLLEENKRKRENAFNKNKKEEEANPSMKNKNLLGDESYNNKNVWNSNNNNFNNQKKFDLEVNAETKQISNVGGANSHVYKDNFSKIKNEKDIIEKMENVRNAANIKKKYGGPDSDEDSEYEKFQRLNRLMRNDASKKELTQHAHADDDYNYTKLLNNTNERNEDSKGYIKRNNYDYSNDAKDEFDSYGFNGHKNFDESDVKNNSIPKYRSNAVEFKDKGENRNILNSESKNYNYANYPRDSKSNYSNKNDFSYSSVLKDKKEQFDNLFSKEEKTSADQARIVDNYQPESLEEKYFKRDNLNESEKQNKVYDLNDTYSKYKKNDFNKDYQDNYNYRKNYNFNNNSKDFDPYKNKECAAAEEIEDFDSTKKRNTENDTKKGKLNLFNANEKGDYENNYNQISNLNSSIENKYKRNDSKKQDSFRLQSQNLGKNVNDSIDKNYSYSNNNKNFNKFKRDVNNNNDKNKSNEFNYELDSENIDGKKSKNFNYTAKEKKLINSEMDENSEDHEYKRFLSNRMRDIEENYNSSLKYQKNNNHFNSNNNNFLDNPNETSNLRSDKRDQNSNKEKYDNSLASSDVNNYLNCQEENVFSPKFNFDKNTLNKKNKDISSFVNRSRDAADEAESERDIKKRNDHSNDKIFKKYENEAESENEQKDNYNYYNNNSDENNENNDDSFENKVKNLQQEKVKSLKKNTNTSMRNDSTKKNTKFKSSEKSNKGNLNKNSSNLNNKGKEADNKLKNNRLSKPKIDPNYRPKIGVDVNASNNYNQFSTLPVKNNRNFPAKGINNFNSNNNENPNKNLNNSNNNEVELSKLKKENSKLSNENKKLKDELNKEKQKNQKFKSFAEELIKFYEKSMKSKNS